MRAVNVGIILHFYARIFAVESIGVFYRGRASGAGGNESPSHLSGLSKYSKGVGGPPLSLAPRAHLMLQTTCYGGKSSERPTALSGRLIPAFLSNWMLKAERLGVHPPHPPGSTAALCVCFYAAQLLIPCRDLRV